MCIALAMLHGESGSFDTQILYLLDFESSDGLHAVGNNFPGEVARHRADARIVVVQVGNLGFMQALDELGLGLRDLVDGLEKFQMHGIDIRHNAFVGLSNQSQLADLAFGGHAHFQNANVLVALRAQKAERHPEFIVQIACGTQNRELFP